MKSYFLEFFQLHSRPGADVRIVSVEAPLKAEQFPPNTIFINRTSPLAVPAPLLELEASFCKGLTPGRCYLPNIPVFDARAAVPAEYRERGRPIAFLDRIPAIIEYPENRFWFNFDVHGAIQTIQRERYFTKPRPLYTYLPFNVQTIPPGLRQAASKLLKGGKAGPKPSGGTALFPEYPKDWAVELLTNAFRHCAEKTTGATFEPRLWPQGKKYAFIVTHDVDSAWLYKDDNLAGFMKMEGDMGVPGAWYFVNNLYEHDYAKIDRLVAGGHEIGLHGDNHDHKISFLSDAEIEKRLSGCRKLIDRYRITGYRAPHYLRTPRFYEHLKRYVRYDTSMHDAYNPTSKVSLMREGCSSLLPFTLSDDQESLLELPITIPEDYELYDPEAGASSVIEGQLAQIAEVKRRGGLANLVIHPEPHFTGRKPCFEAFTEVLRSVSKDPECWIVLPRDLNDYWRRLAPAATR
ncbi:MAG: DUF2334 domain-containing protein [Elusimicrobia bacterium]|nr:DUF2334 domain-containing protein [Elusimicrobiota bacterium]